MKIEGYRIWAILFVAIFALSGYMYFTILENRDQLQEQSFRSLELTKNNLLSSWDNLSVRTEPPYNFDEISESDLRELLQTLLNQMPPSNFFDLTFLTDRSGKLLISSPEIPLITLPPEYLDETEKLGAIREEISISTREYQVFRVPITLEEQSQTLSEEGTLGLYLFGAISQDKFDRAGRQISFTGIYLLFTLLMLLIISFPILRVVGMGRGDTLLRTHVYQIGLSIVLLAVFIGFSISYIMSRNEIKTEHLQNIDRLIEEVTDLQRSELGRYTDLFHSYFSDEDLTADPALRYNEIFEIRADGYVNRFRISDLDTDLTENQMQDIPNLSGRYYFRDAREDQFLLGSHYSYSDGIQEGVLSRRISEEELGETDGEVRAITFGFNHFFEADTVHLNRIGLKYLIMNSSGDVYYQTPSIRTNIPNIKNAISSDQWDQVYALMRNNPGLAGSLEVPVSFEGQNYVAHLNRLEFGIDSEIEPAWMLTFRDKNLRYMRSYSIFLYSSAGYLILILSFIFIFTSFYLSGKTSHFLNLKTFAYSWFRPSVRRRKQYFYLVVVLFLHLLFFIYILTIDFHNFWLVVFLFCETVAVIALYRYVLLSKFLESWKKKRYWKVPFLISIIVIVFLSFSYIAGTLSGGKFGLITTLFLFQLAGFAGIIVFKVKKWFASGITAGSIHEVNSESVYAFSFTLWVLVVGLIPGYIIHHSAFHHENVIWQQAVQNERPVQPELPSPLTDEETSSYRQLLLNQMEYQRRQWLVNYTGIEYPVIDRYIYSDRATILSAFQHDHHTHEHGKEFSAHLLNLLIFLLIGYLFFISVRLLARQLFLTEYWDYGNKTEFIESIRTKTYLVTLDNQKGLDFLNSRFDEKIRFTILDLSVPNLTEEFNAPIFPEKEKNNSYLLMNIDHILNSSENINRLTSFIHICQKHNILLVLTGSKSVKELRNITPKKDDPEFEQAMQNWSEAMSQFSTITIPIHYGIDSLQLVERFAENDFLNILDNEVEFGPHREELSLLLSKEISETKENVFPLKNFEKFLLSVQRYNKAYFQNLWDKLSFREKQMVYNYSNEGFVNYRNFDVLTELLEKGIFRMNYRDEEIGLFSKSFTNFASNAANSELLKKFKIDRKENGNVTHIRNAILTFIFLSILGLSLVAPEVLDRYVGAISGGLAILSTLASLLNKYAVKFPFLKDVQS
ncbi:hypothetical protein DYD21_09820 [Rhodohalobacter sp. SW132]|uniref:hypothetical protein n=1 Tax=Rhodohalobacter sp. SW132 TaxID=2293433 RepID=UPI000E251E4C|nr:hypothetical protein [Rhodohalobacter sp. SW132]REL33697.1 hypothetical protein DYD21_09820 [Rhodohalobacter sp. SW132]